MGVLEDIDAAVAKVTAAQVPADPSADPNALTSEVFQKAEAQADIENKDDRGFFDKVSDFAQGVWDFGGSVVGGAADIAEHIFPNEDDDKGINNWDRYKQYTKDVATGDYTTEQILQKKRELYNDKVITDKYIMNEQEAASRPVQNATSSQELEQKIRRNLTAQLAPQMATNPSQDVAKILNQAIETQTKTYMDYYNRISESDDAMDKDKYYDQLADFMEKGKTFIRDYADNVVKTADNQQAYYAAEEKNMEFIQDMDSFNSALTTSSQWAGLKGASSRLFLDGEVNSNDIPNAWGVVVGLLGNAGHNLLGRPLHGVKMVTGGWNSGFEELRNDYIEKSSDSFFDKSLGNMRFAVQEIVDGSDTLLAAAIPVMVELFVPGAQIGLLSKAESAARLVSKAGKLAKAGSFLRTLGVQQLQNAVFFDNMFQTFQRRGYNLEDLKANLSTNLVMDSLFVGLFMKPVLKGTEEFRKILQDSGYNALNFADEEAVIVAANAGKTREVEHSIRLNVIKAQNGEEIPKAITRPTEEGKKILSRANARMSSGMKAIVENGTSTEGFDELIKYNTAMNRKPGIQLTEETLQKKEEAQKALIETAVTDKKYVGKHTLASMEDTPDVERIVAAAIAKTMADSTPLAGTEYEFTQKMADALQQKLVDARRGIASELNQQELLHAERVMESIVDVVKAETDIQHLFPEGVLPAVKLSSASKTFKTLPGYTELALQLESGKEPKNYAEFVKQAFDDALPETTIESLLPQIVVPQLESFTNKIVRKFGDKDSRVLNMHLLRGALTDTDNKYLINEDQFSALSMYHIGSIIDNITRLKAADELGEISNTDLVKSHPIFSIYTKGEDGMYRANVPTGTTTDINDALGRLFQKNPLGRVRELPIISTLIKSTKFKSELQKIFTDIVDNSSKQATGHNVWSLVDGLLMDPVTVKKIEAVYVDDIVAGKAILNDYVLKVVRRSPELEGAYYGAWLKKIPAAVAFRVDMPYSKYATDFNITLDALLTDVPSTVDKVHLKNKLLALGADSIIELNKIEYLSAISSYQKSFVKNDLELLEVLKEEFAKETTTVERKMVLSERIAKGEKYINDKINKLDKNFLSQEKISADLLRNRKSVRHSKPDLILNKKILEVSEQAKKEEIENQGLTRTISRYTQKEFDSMHPNYRNGWISTWYAKLESDERLKNINKELTTLRGEQDAYYIRSTWKEAITKNTKIAPAISNIINAQGAVSFEKTRDALRKIMMSTEIDDSEFLSVQHLLLLPKSMLGDFGEYKKALEALKLGNIKSPTLFYEAIVRNKMFEHTKNVEEIYDILKYAYYETPKVYVKETSAEISKARLQREMPAHIARTGFLSSTVEKVTKVEGKSIIIVGSDKNLAVGAATHTLKNSQHLYLTLFELYEALANPVVKKEILSGKHGNLFITENALKNYTTLFNTKQSVVSSDTEGLRELLRSGKSLTRLDIDLTKSYNKPTRFILSDSGDAKIFTQIKKSKLLSKEDAKELGLLLKENKKNTSIIGIAKPIDAVRAEDILDQILSVDNFTGLLWNTVNKNFPIEGSIDILKYARGPDFKEQYGKFVETSMDLFNKGLPGADITKDGWFIKGVTLTEEQYHAFSQMRLVAMDSKKSINEIFGEFDDIIKGKFIERIVNNDIDAQKFATYSILNSLRREKATVPFSLTQEQLINIVGNLDTTTINTLSSLSRQFVHSEKLVAKDEEILRKWVAIIEGALKDDTYLIANQSENGWALFGDVSLDKVDGFIGDTVDEYSGALTDTADQAILDNNYQALSAEKLEQQEGRWADIFTSIGEDLGSILTKVTKNVYTRSSFNTYINLDRDVIKLLAIPENKTLFDAYKNIDTLRSIKFTDTKRYMVNPKAIDTDWDTTNFYINGTLITSRRQARDEILISLARQTDTPTKLAFNMVAAPKDSLYSIMPAEGTQVGVKVLKEGESVFTQKAELKGVAAFLQGGSDFLENPLVKWAFEDELKSPFASLETLARDWVSRESRIRFSPWNKTKKSLIPTELDKLRRASWEKIQAYVQRDRNTYVSKTQFEKVEEVWNQNKLKNILSERAGIKPEEIKSIQLMEYIPVGVISDTDTGEFIRYIAGEKAITIDNALQNFSDFFRKEEGEEFLNIKDETALEDVIETGIFKIRTSTGSTFILDEKYGNAFEHNSKVGDFFRDWANFSLEVAETPQLTNKQLIETIHQKYTVREERSFGNLLDLAKENSTNGFLKDLSDIMERFNIIKKEEIVYVGAPKNATNGGSSIRGAKKSVIAINSVVVDNADTSGNYFLEVLLHEKAHEFTSQIIRNKVNSNGKTFIRDVSAKVTEKEAVYIDALTTMHSTFMKTLSPEDITKFGYETKDLAEFAVAFTKPEIAQRMKEIQYMDMNLLEYLTKKFLEFIGANPTMYDSMVANYMNFVTDYVPAPQPFKIGDDMIHNFGKDYELEDLIGVSQRDRTWRKDAAGKFIRSTPSQIKSQYDTQIKALKNTAEKIAAGDPKTLQVWEDMRTGKIDVLSGDVGAVAGAKHIQQEYKEAMHYAVKVAGKSSRTKEQITGFAQSASTKLEQIQSTIDGEKFYTYQNIEEVQVLEDYTQRIQDEYTEKMIAYFRDNTPESIATRLTTDIEDVEAAKQAHLMREEAFNAKKSGGGTKTNLDDIDTVSNAHINSKQKAFSEQQERDYAATLDLLDMAEESILRSDVPVDPKKKRTVFQKIADSIQVNNRALFDIHTGDGWYSNALGSVMQLRRGMSGQGALIMHDFATVSQDMLTRSDVSPEKFIAAISYAGKPQIFWETLDEYRRGYNGANYSASVFETIVSKMSTEGQSILRASKQEFKNAFTDGITIANKGDIFNLVSPEYKGVVERFIKYTENTELIDVLTFFFDKALNRSDFIRKAMEHDSYLGILQEMYRTNYYRQVKDSLAAKGIKIPLTTDMLVEKYVLENVARVQPNLELAVQKKNRDILLIKQADKERKLEGFPKFFRAVVREARGLSTPLKFFVNPASGILMGGQNLTTNIFQAAGASKGMNPYYINHPVIQHMLDTGILEGNLIQSHLDNMNGVDMGGKNFVEKLYDATANKAAYYIAAHVPTEAGKKAAEFGADLVKDIVTTGWHNVQDPLMQGTHMRIGLAQAILETAGDDFDGFLWMLKNNKMPDTLFNKFIVRARELGESGNNTQTADMLRRHILSGSGWKLAFSYLQGYHMQRLGELTTGLKKLADAQAAGEVNFKDFTSLKAHLWQQNPELRKVIGITFDTIHMGFMLDHYYDDEENQNSLDYAKLFHEYLNTFQANVMGRIISTAVSAYRGKEIYEDATGKELTFYQGVSLEVMDFVDAIPGMMYREFDVYKFIPKLMGSYFTGDPVMNAALRKEMLDSAFSGNYRYSMPTGENTFGGIAMPEQDDIIGSLLLGMHTTNATIALADKMYAVTNADKIIRGADGNELEDSWFEKTLKTLPFIEYFTQNSRSKTAEWKALQALMTTDPIMKGLYARDNDIFTQYINQYIGVPEKYTSEVNDFWKDLTAFNYAQWDKKDLGTTRKDDFYDNKLDEEAKEELFTTLLENKLGKDFVANINTEIEQYIFDESDRNETTLGAGILKSKMPGPTGDEMGIQKIFVTAEALQPGSAKVIMAYMANKKWYDYAQKHGPKNAKGYPDTAAFKNTEESTQIKKMILDQMYPNVYLADKTAYLKVIRNQAKNKYPEVFSKMTDSSKSLINTMSLSAFMTHQEILSGKPSAGNINAMVVASTKYVKNDADRLMALNYGLRGIYSLPATLDEKDMAATGMLYSNVDMLHRLAKDEVFKKEYPGQVEYAAQKLFGIADKNILEGYGNVHAMIEKDMTAADKQSYYKTYGSAYSQRPYNATNKALQDKMFEKANSQGAGGARALYNPGKSGSSYARPMSLGKASQMSAIPRPQVLDSYFKMARDEGVLSITSPALLKQTVKRNLEGENGGYRQPQVSSYKKRIGAPTPSVRPIRTASIKKRGPNVQLPLGLINIG